jgi:glycosyltransferase involved in cell wall biosynthesis
MLSSHSYERDGVQMVESPDLLPGRARTGWDPYNTLYRSAFVRRQQYDIVHAFDSRPAVIYPALAAAKISNALFVMDWADWWGRGGWINERSGWLVRRTFGPVETWFEEAFRTRAHGLTVASRALGDRSRTLGVDHDRIEVLPGGCEMTVARSATREHARATLNLADDEPLILHVGVLTPGDFTFLCDAFARVRSALPHARLVLAGRTGMRITRAPEGVSVTGAIDDATLEAWLAAANVCVVPCRDTIGNRGRWPSKTNDYLCAARAVVMPHVSDAADVIKDNHAGWTTLPDAQSFAVGIESALRDIDAADAAGARGRAVAANQLAWTGLTDRLISFYDRLSSRR